MSVQGPLTQPWLLGAYCLVCGAPYAETASGRPADLGRTITVIVHCSDCGPRAGEWAITATLEPADSRANARLKEHITGRLPG